MLFLTPLQFVHLFCNLCNVCPAVLMYFISAAVILLASLALIVQVLLPYNKTGRASGSFNASVNILILISQYIDEVNSDINTDHRNAVTLCCNP